MRVSTGVAHMSKLPSSEEGCLLDRQGDSAENRRLGGRTVPRASLDDRQLGQMYALLREYFSNTSYERFAFDLAEKEWVILLEDLADGEIRGFSTLMRLVVRVPGEELTVFYSGDTIIHREFWGETVLPRLWSRLVFRLAENDPERRAFWFLISSGYKTYRFLPVFFREFYPVFDRPTPPMAREIIDSVARRKFPDEYDEAAGVVRFRAAAPLRRGVADITPARLNDPHIAFFANANPGFGNGDELACLTEINRRNLTPAGRRMLGTTGEGLS